MHEDNAPTYILAKNVMIMKHDILQNFTDLSLYVIKSTHFLINKNNYVIDVNVKNTKTSKQDSRVVNIKAD